MGGSGTYVNGTNSNSPEPEYLYDSAGIYTVILTATDLNGCQGYDTNTIIVDTLPIKTLMLQKFVTMILQYLYTIHRNI